MDRYFSKDVLVDILLRLPPSSRRRARLVCRHWRDVVNERTTEMQSRPKVLLWNIYRAVPYLSDDLSMLTGNCTPLWTTSEPRHHLYSGLQLVGTCNGLLCLCDNRKSIGGHITLFNPVTDETLHVPPLPSAEQFIGHHSWERWGDAYSFAYHPITGRYKLVHVPCSYERVCDFNSIHVLTLGEAKWREIPAGPGGAMCNLAAGVVSVDGTTYWVRVTGGAAAKIVSLDLMDERVTSTTTPVPVRRDRYRLTEVHGKLGFVASGDVWVLEEGKRWRHQSSFEQGIPRRYFVFGEYVLTYAWLSFYGHRLKGTSSSGQDVVRFGPQDVGTLVAKITQEQECYWHYQTFPYVETTEPLSVYAVN